MSENIVALPLYYYGAPNKKGPLFNAKIYVGIPDLDPRILANRYDIIFKNEDGTTVPISPSQQPVRTSSGGYPTYNGQIGQILVDGNYSIAVDSSQDVQQYYWPNYFDGQPLTQGDEGLIDHNKLSGLSGSIAHDAIYLRNFNSIQSMIDYDAHELGNEYLTATTRWKVVSVLTPFSIDNFEAENAIDVIGCGAVGDGLTDDSDAIQLAFDIVKSGGSVFFPKTRLAETGDLEPQYLITKDIVIEKADLGIYGETSSEYTTGILCNTANVNMFNFKNPGSRISNLAFFGNGGNTEFGTTTGILIDRRDNGDSDNFANLDFIIDNCLFFDNGIGVHGWGRNVLVRNSLFTHLKVSVRCSSWIPAGGGSHVDIRGWRIINNRFHSNGWQYNFPGSIEVPPTSFGAWDSFCIQMPADSDNFRGVEVTNNNLDRGYSIFYRGMVAGLNLSNNTAHDFNGALVYGLTTTQGAIDRQNEYPSKICGNLLNLRESYDQPYDQPKTFGIIISDCDVLTISDNNIKNTLQEAIKLTKCFHTNVSSNNVQNAGQEKFNTVAFPAITLDECVAVTIDSQIVNAKYPDNDFNTAGIKLVNCSNIGISNPDITKSTIKIDATPEMLRTGNNYTLEAVVPTIELPYTIESGQGYQRMISGETTLNIRVNSNGASSGALLLTLPVGCRPLSVIRQSGVGSNQEATATINTNGEVTVNHGGTSATLYSIDMQFLSQ